MDGLNKITNRISAEAQEEVAKIKAEAEEKCLEIKASFDSRAQEEYERLMKEGRKDVELQAQRLSGAAALEAKKIVLAMKQGAVSEVLEEAVEAISNLPEAEYVDFLTKLAADAAFTGEEELIFNARDKAAVSKTVQKNANELIKKRKLPGSLTISNETGSFKGGLMVRQGDIIANCTVETLVEMSRDALSSPIAEILFSE